MTGAPIRGGGVLVDGATIADVGPSADLAARHAGAQVVDWSGVLTPGLLNGHTHLQYTHFADLGEVAAGQGAANFPDWIAAVTRRRAEFDDAAWRASVRRGLSAAFAAGTTAVADVVTDPCVLDEIAGSGIGGIAFVEVVGMDEGRWARSGRGALVAALDCAPAGLAVGVSPHSLYTLSSAVIRDCAAIARARGLRLHAHAAETPAEDLLVRSGTGPLADWLASIGFNGDLVGCGTGSGAVSRLAQLGLAGPDVHLAHGVQVDDGDIELLRRTGTAVALCPRSNAFLGAGEPPVAAYLDAGAPILIGTDSLASAPSLDLFADAAELARLCDGAPDVHQRLVAALTSSAADSLGLPGGRLRPGGPADLAVFDVPAEGDPYRSLVEGAAGRCAGTVVGGRIVHQRRDPR